MDHDLVVEINGQIAIAHSLALGVDFDELSQVVQGSQLELEASASANRDAIFWISVVFSAWADNYFHPFQTRSALFSAFGNFGRRTRGRNKAQHLIFVKDLLTLIIAGDLIGIQPFLIETKLGLGGLSIQASVVRI